MTSAVVGAHFCCARTVRVQNIGLCAHTPRRKADARSGNRVVKSRLVRSNWLMSVTQRTHKEMMRIIKRNIWRSFVGRCSRNNSNVRSSCTKFYSGALAAIALKCNKEPARILLLLDLCQRTGSAVGGIATGMKGSSSLVGRSPILLLRGAKFP